jgi:hypothetical protein
VKLLVAPLALLGAVSVDVFAQTGGGGDFDPLALLQQIGIGAVLASSWIWQWRDERKQRQAAEERERALAREMVPLLSRSVEALEAVADKVDVTSRRARNDDDVTTRRLENLVGELGDALSHLKPDEEPTTKGPRRRGT